MASHYYRMIVVLMTGYNMKAIELSQHVLLRAYCSREQTLLEKTRYRLGIIGDARNPEGRWVSAFRLTQGL